MDFAEWVKVNRTKMGWDLRTLEEKSGVDNSSIIRIENQKTQSTLISAVRLWQAFNIPYESFINDIGVASKLDQFPGLANQKLPHSLDLDDLCHFISIALKNEEKAKDFCRSWIDRFIKIYHGPWFQTIFDLKKGNHFWNMDYQFPYPSDINEEDLKEWFITGEAIIFLDAGTWMALKRKKNNLSLLDMEQNTQISDTVLGRIEHGIINNIKVKDLIQINNFIDTDGLFFAIHWMAGLQTIKIKEIIAEHFSRREAQKFWPVEQATYNLVKFQRLIRKNKDLLSEFINSLRNQ